MYQANNISLNPKNFQILPFWMKNYDLPISCSYYDFVFSVKDTKCDNKGRGMLGKIRFLNSIY